MKRVSSSTDGDGTSKVLELQYTTPYGKVIQTFGTSSSSYEFKTEKGTRATKTVEPYGSNMGCRFDDGVFESVKKLCVGEDSRGVVYIKPVYMKDGFEVYRQHGRGTGGQKEKEFEVAYPDEYITSIWGLCKEKGYRYKKKSLWEEEYGCPNPFGNDDDDDDDDGDDGEIRSAVARLQLTTSHGRKSILFGNILFGNY